MYLYQNSQYCAHRAYALRTVCTTPYTVALCVVLRGIYECSRVLEQQLEQSSSRELSIRALLSCTLKQSSTLALVESIESLLQLERASYQQRATLELLLSSSSQQLLSSQLESSSQQQQQQLATLEQLALYSSRVEQSRAIQEVSINHWSTKQ